MISGEGIEASGSGLGGSLVTFDLLVLYFGVRRMLGIIADGISFTSDGFGFFSVDLVLR